LINKINRKKVRVYLISKNVNIASGTPMSPWAVAKRSRRRNVCKASKEAKLRQAHTYPSDSECTQGTVKEGCSSRKEERKRKGKSFQAFYFVKRALKRTRKAEAIIGPSTGGIYISGQ